MSDNITTYESLDDRIAPEAITEDLGKGLDIVDGHAVKAPGDYENPDKLYDMLIARILHNIMKHRRSNRLLIHLQIRKNNGHP